VRHWRAMVRGLILSGVLTAGIFANPAKANDPGLTLIDRVMEQAVSALMDAAPDLTEVEALPFAGINGHSTCSAALTDRLLIALDAEARHPNRILRERPLAVRRLSAMRSQGSASVATAVGAFDHDATGRDAASRSWLTLEFRRNGATIAPTGRVSIPAEALGCDPILRPFLDHVAATARTDSGALTVTAHATPFVRGQRLDIRIETRMPLHLYCWVLAADQSAFVTLPAREAKTTSVPAGIRHYPRHFGLEEIVLGQPFENLFGCFGSPGPWPEALQQRWHSAAPGANADSRLVTAAEVEETLALIRSLPDVREATARIIVK
jgi:hypothetical protein